MTNIDEMLEKKEAGFVSCGPDADGFFTLTVANENNPGKVWYTQPGCTPDVLLSEIIENGNWNQELGVNPDADLRLKKAKNADYNNGESLPKDARKKTLGELGFFKDGFDTLLVNTGGDNG